VKKLMVYPSNLFHRLSDSSSIVLPTPSSNSEIEEMGQQPHHSRHNNNNNNNNHNKKSNVNSDKAATTSTSAMVNQRANDVADARNQAASGSTSDVFYLAVYGWRKKCLFTLILLLMVLIIINLSLTLWILKVMEFSGVSVTRSLGVEID
jgi:Sarcoglycan complex subunit protein